MKISANKILMIAVVLLLLTNIALVAFMVMDRGKHGDRGKGRTDPFAMMVKELDMTAQQEKDCKQLKEDFFNNNKAVFDSVKAAKTAFFALVTQPQLSDSLLDASSRKVSEKQAIADKLVFAHFRKMRAIFTPEQQPKFDKFLQKMMSMRGHRDSAGKKER